MLSNGSGSSALYLAISFLAICSGVAWCESPSHPPVSMKELAELPLLGCLLCSFLLISLLTVFRPLCASNQIKKFQVHSKVHITVLCLTEKGHNFESRIQVHS